MATERNPKHNSDKTQTSATEGKFSYDFSRISLHHPYTVGTGNSIRRPEREASSGKPRSGSLEVPVWLQPPSGYQIKVAGRQRQSSLENPFAAQPDSKREPADKTASLKRKSGCLESLKSRGSQEDQPFARHFSPEWLRPPRNPESPDRPPSGKQTPSGNVSESGPGRRSSSFGGSLDERQPLSIQRPSYGSVGSEGVFIDGVSECEPELPGRRDPVLDSVDSDLDRPLVMPALPTSSSSRCWPVRYRVALLCALGFLCSSVSQHVLAASFLTMVAPPLPVYNGSGPTTGGTPRDDVICPAFIRLWAKGLYSEFDAGSDAGSHTNMTKFLRWSGWHWVWSEDTQGYVLLAYFLGYYGVQMPVGLLTRQTSASGPLAWLTMRTGPRHVLLVAAFGLTALQLLAILTPHVAVGVFTAVMAACGVLTGCLYVPMMDILARWTPPQESSQMASLAISGHAVGVAVVYGLSALSVHTDLYGGWPINFLCLGVLLLLFSVFVLVFVTDSPSTNRWIGAAEANHIQDGISRTYRRQMCLQDPKTFSTPVVHIVTSGPVLGIAAAQFATDWLQYFLVVLFPYYLHHTRGLPIQTAEMIAGIPWLVFPVSSYVISALVDSVRKKGLVPTTLLRKIVDFFAKFVPVLLLVWIVYLPLGVSKWIIFSMHVLIVIFLSAMGSTWVPNILDLTTEFAAFVASYCQVISLLGSFFLPLAVNSVTRDNTVELWRTCVWIMLGIVAAAYLIYVLLGSSHPRRWPLTPANAAATSYGSVRSISRSCCCCRKDREDHLEGASNSFDEDGS